jgi:FkbM family methyltransferase
VARRFLGDQAPIQPRRTILGLNEIGLLARAELEEASRAAASPVYLGDNVALCRILGRYKFYVDTRDITFGAHVLLDGFWEPWITRFMARKVRPGWVVADVGANFGYYSLLLADLVGPEGRVHSVEPNPAAVELLRRSVMLNGFSGRTTVHALAAGESDGGSAKLWVPARNPGGAALAYPAGVPSDCERLDVGVSSLDALLASEQSVDFVKIDAEGSEQRIFAGMGRLLERFRPAVLLEFHPAWYADPSEFLCRLGSLYGSLRHIDYDGEAVPIAPETLISEPTERLLFLEPE